MSDLNLPGGVVDLSLLAKRREITDDAEHHQHWWAVQTKFAVPPQTMQEFQNSVNVNKRREEQGQEPVPINVQVPLQSERMIDMEGPGCLKCSLLWNSNGGLGELCQVSDDQFQANGMVAIPPDMGLMNQGLMVAHKQMLVAQEKVN